MTTIKLLLKWLYGIGFAVSGLVLMFSTSFIGGLIFIIGGLILLPPILKMIEGKIRSRLTRPIKYLTVIGTIFIGIIYIANNHVDKENETKKQEQEAFEKLPQHVKDRHGQPEMFSWFDRAMPFDRFLKIGFYGFGFRQVTIFIDRQTDLKRSFSA